MTAYLAAAVCIIELMKFLKQIIIEFSFMQLNSINVALEFESLKTRLLCRRQKSLPCGGGGRIERIGADFEEVIV